MIKSAMFLLQVAFVYVIFFFVLLEPNPIKWSEGSRFMFAMSIFSAWIAILIIPAPPKGK